MELFFRIAEASVYSLLLYFSDMSPAELFKGREPSLLTVSVICMIFRTLTVPPLTCAAAFRLTELCCGNEGVTPLWEKLTDTCFLFRSVLAGIFCRLISMLFFIPVLLSCSLLLSLISKGGGENELFAIFQTAVLTVLTLILWADIKLTLSSVPFLLAVRPYKSTLNTVFHSFRFMRGRKVHFMLLLGIYAAPILSVIGLPFVLPDLMTAFVISISVFDQEDQYRYSPAVSSYH